jgi:hypothetical protein
VPRIAVALHVVDRRVTEMCPFLPVDEYKSGHSRSSPKIRKQPIEMIEAILYRLFHSGRCLIDVIRVCGLNLPEGTAQ